MDARHLTGQPRLHARGSAVTWGRLITGVTVLRSFVRFHASRAENFPSWEMITDSTANTTTTTSNATTTKPSQLNYSYHVTDTIQPYHYLTTRTSSTTIANANITTTSTTVTKII